MNGISALRKEAPQQGPGPFCPVRTQHKAPSMNQETSPGSKPAGVLFLDSSLQNSERYVSDVYKAIPFVAFVIAGPD